MRNNLKSLFSTASASISFAKWRENLKSRIQEEGFCLSSVKETISNGQASSQGTFENYKSSAPEIINNLRRIIEECGFQLDETNQDHFGKCVDKPLYYLLETLRYVSKQGEQGREHYIPSTSSIAADSIIENCFDRFGLTFEAIEGIIGKGAYALAMFEQFCPDNNVYTTEKTVHRAALVEIKDLLLDLPLGSSELSHQNYQVLAEDIARKMYEHDLIETENDNEFTDFIQDRLNDLQAQYDETKQSLCEDEHKNYFKARAIKDFTHSVVSAVAPCISNKPIDKSNLRREGPGGQKLTP